MKVMNFRSAIIQILYAELIKNNNKSPKNPTLQKTHNPPKPQHLVFNSS